MDDLTIRKATRTDLKVLLKFEQELIIAERPFDSTIRKDPLSYYNLESMLNDSEVQIVVAEYKDKVISSGSVSLKSARSYLDHDTYAYLGFMYTIPKYRGRGVNKKIIDALKKWATAKGLREIRLTVYDDNEVAIRAYEKVGFKKHIIEMRLT